MDAQSKIQSAYLTVYLAFILALLVSLCLALTEGVRCNAILLESECVTDIGMNSILAEYHRELFAQYNLFAIDSTYGTAVAGKGNVENHLKGYMERNFSNDGLFLGEYLYRDFLGLSVEKEDVTGVRLLSDEEGAVFQQAAVAAIRDDVGLTGLEQMKEWIEDVDNHQLLAGDYEEEWEEINRQIAEVATVDFVNPVEHIGQMRRTGILKKVLTGQEQLSDKALRTEQLLESRMDRGEVSHGNLGIIGTDGLETLQESFLFREYLMKYMGCYRAPKNEGALSYQIEYLIAGKDADQDNLKAIARKLCGIREVANMVYLTSDREKCQRVQLVAEGISTLLTVPELSPLLETAMLLGWSYAESIYDVRTLMAGGRVPLLKNAEDWHYSLQNVLQSFLQNDQTVSDSKSGLHYEDYLRLVMMCMSDQSLSKRAMNMVEADIRLTPGNAGFRLDACMDSVKVEVFVKSSYGYSYQIISEKSY